MTLGEFVKIDPQKIRRDNELMQLYINFYEAAFSLIPNCVGCSFKSGFKKLKHYAIHGEKNINFDKNTIEMKSKTFLLKKQYLTKILTYVKDGSIHRKYGNQLTEEFAIELVKAGKGDLFINLPKEIEVNYWDKMPKSEKEAMVSVEINENGSINKVEVFNKDYASMDYHKEILPLYAEVRERTGKQANSRKQSNIIKFLQDNES
jgi:hypothetical protein